MNVAAYLRVSTDEQAREGYSIAAQRDRLLSFARAQDWQVYDVYADEGFSGAKLDRPQLTRLREDAKAGKIQLILVWKLDRLSRKVSHLSRLVEELATMNVGFRSATEPFDTSHAAGRAFMQMLSVFAELERETIRERTRMGIRQRVAEGYVHGRPTPFGYRRRPDGTFEVREEEADVVRLIFRRYQEGLGVSKIAQELAKSSLPVPAAKKDGLHYDRLTSLQDRVRWMLDNPIYAGYTSLGDELFTGRHPAIIPQEQWAAVQALRKGERALPSRARRSVYPLSGLAKCGECGRSMSGFKQPNRAKDPAARAARPSYNYYICTGSTAVRGHSKACTNWGMIAEHVEDQVVATLRQLQLDLETMGEAVTEQAAAAQADEEMGQVGKLKRRLALVRRRREKWFKAFEDGDDTLEAAARERLRELANEEQEILRAVSDEEARQAPRQALGRDVVLATLGQLDQAPGLLTPEERRQLYRIFVRELRVYKDKHMEIDLWPL